MTLGVFVQVNADSPWGASRAHPVGYVIQENGCWDWVGARRPTGHGIWHRDGKHITAYRALYEQAKGAVPRGLYLDHLCKNPACVNPDHLEPVTNGENVLRGTGVTATNKRKTVCHRGHPLEPHPSRPTERRCRTCKRERDNRARREARRALLALDLTPFSEGTR